MSIANPGPRHVGIFLWVVLICCVIVGTLVPATSPLIAALIPLHVTDFMKHVYAYAALASLMTLACRDRQRRMIASLATFALGILLELAQHFSPGRSVEFEDVAANGLGVVSGTGIVLVIRKVVSRLNLASGPPLSPHDLKSTEPGLEGNAAESVAEAS